MPSFKDINKSHSKEITESFTDFLDAWGVDKVIDVPIMKDESTLCLPAQRCFQNVAHMQMENGGNTVLGFTFSKIDSQENQAWWLEPHAVWRTSKNEYVDISLSRDTFDFVEFAPVVSFDANKEFYELFERYRFKRTDMSWHRSDYETVQGEYPRKNIWWKDKDMTSLIFHRNEPMWSSDNWGSYLQERADAKEFYYEYEQ